MNEGIRIKNLRKSKRYTQEDLAQVLREQYNLKTTRAMVSKWETDYQKPEKYTLTCLAEIFHVSIEYLEGTNNNPYLLKTEFVPLVSNLTPIFSKKIKLLGHISCGEPLYAQEEELAEIIIPDQVQADYCLVCKGDSMINARIFNGDIVFISRQPDVENGQIAAVLIDDEATLKRVYKYQDRICLRAENPTFADLNYEGEKMSEVHILGKATAFFSTIK